MRASKPTKTVIDLPQNTRYWYFVIAYVAFQLVSDVTAGKIVQIGSAVVSASVLYFPFTYLISDVLTEVYGYGRARRALWSVLAASVLAGVIYQIVVALPPGPGFSENEAYKSVLGVVPRILIAGWIAVFSGDIANDFVMSKLKVITNGRSLWLRVVSSTIIGQGINTGIFYIGALYGVLPNHILLEAIFWAWGIKIGVEVIFIPLTYLVIRKLKQHDGLDTFDQGIDYNPFLM